MGVNNPLTSPSPDPGTSPNAIIGLDIGGSKTRGIRWQDGAVQVDAAVGSANVQNVRRQEAAANLAELFGILGGSGVAQVFAGSGGIDTPEDAEALAALITPHVPGARVTVVHDTRLLLAAGGARTGVAVIAGTGSAAWGRNADDAEARAGGWGYLLGDEGSGYWLGREAVRHSLRRMNQGLAPDMLTDALLTECGLAEPSELIAHFHGNTGRRYWAAMSPLVFRAAAKGHPESLTMIDTAARDLAELAVTCARQLRLSGPIVLGSGLGQNQPPLQEAFRRHVAKAGLTDVRVLHQDPIFGVLTLAS